MGSFIVGLVVFTIIGLAAFRVYKDYKNGDPCGCGRKCSSGCSGCSK